MGLLLMLGKRCAWQQQVLVEESPRRSGGLLLIFASGNLGVLGVSNNMMVVRGRSAGAAMTAAICTTRTRNMLCILVGCIYKQKNVQNRVRAVYHSHCNGSLQVENFQKN